MSFFVDFFKDFDLKDDDVKIFFVQNKCINLSGKVVLLEFNDDCLFCMVNNKKYKIIGDCLIIKSLAKNEVCVIGNVKGFVEE